jgi:hypothetical protein
VGHIKTLRSLRHIPWKKVVVALAVAALLAWGVGFLAGVLVRLRFGV